MGKIARFSNLNTERKMYEAQLKKAQEELTELTDALEELECTLEEDSSLLLVGDVFLPVDDDEATQYAESQQAELQEKIERIHAKLTETVQQSETLKTELKGMFGDAINLEE